MKRFALLLTACGRMNFDPLATNDAGGDGSVADVASSDTPGGLVCPTGFMRVDDACYRMNHFPQSGDGVTFLAAEALCESQGGHLVIVDDATELTRVIGLMLPGSDVWIGVSELAQQGVYRTVVNDVATYLPWNTSEPDSGVDACVGLRFDVSAMFDNVCTGLDDALCEYDGRPAVPAAWGQ